MLRCSACERSGHILCVALRMRTALQSTGGTRLVYVGCGMWDLASLWLFPELPSTGERVGSHGHEGCG